MNKSSIPAVILLLIGLPLFLFGLKELAAVNSFVSIAEEAEGTVVEMREGTTKFVPRVRFVTSVGETVEFWSGNGSNPPMYEVGERVPVIYNGAYPQQAMINSFIEIWLGPVIYAGAGLLMLFASVFNRKKG